MGSFLAYKGIEELNDCRFEIEERRKAQGVRLKAKL